MTPTRLDDLALDQRVARGGQGEVWKGRLRGETVAVKIVPTGPRVEAEWARLEGLAHPSIVRARERIAFDQVRTALVLAWIDGVRLDEAAKDPRWTLHHAEHAVRHLLAALTYLHARGIAHRDVKPANVVVDARFFASPQEPAFVVLVDFGIAAPLDSRVPITDLGTVMGTPAYLSPEVLRDAGAKLAPTRDVFAWGVLAWELFAGRHPLGRPTDDGAVGVWYARSYEAARRGSRSFPVGSVDARFEPVLRSCLALEPQDRPADAGAVLSRVEDRASEQSRHGIAGAPTITCVVPLHEQERAPARRPARKGRALLLMALLAGCTVASFAVLMPTRRDVCRDAVGEPVMPTSAHGQMKLRERPSAGAMGAEIGGLTRGAVVERVGGSPTLLGGEPWFHVRVVCAADSALVGKEGYVHGVGLPGLLPSSVLARDATITMRHTEAKAVLPEGTRVGVLTVGPQSPKYVRVLDGNLADEVGSVDASALGP